MTIYNPLEIEPEILKFWDKDKSFQKLMSKLSKSKKQFSFLDGPITANNPMGVHHAWGRAYKDLFLRFKAMQGYNQRRQNGFDSQGLWIEREVEKEKGFKSKEDIEKFGILNFAKACKERVEKFSKLIIQDSIRLGYWMDWGNDYYTMTDNNNLHNWYLIKSYYDKGWLYKGKDVVPWCARCGTASSKHDIITEGYLEITHPAIFMKFPVIGKEKEFLLVWTTTPWTMPADSAVAVSPDIVYAKVKQKDEIYYLAKDRLDILEGNYEELDTLSGADIVGISYVAPYKDLPAAKEATYSVITWDLVSSEEGTGMVHIAPGCGPEDYELGKRERLATIAPLDQAGVYIEGYDWLTGMSAKDANPKIIEDMKKRGFIYKIENYTHRYPHCWRCSEELVFRLVDEWYIRSADIRGKLISENKKIKWYPEYGKTRQETWFKNMSDWLISRKRFWGLPLPIWECECGKIHVFGSLEELKKLALSPKKVDKLPELHRPWIDEIKIRCETCGAEVERIPDVGDAWLDAGIVPLSTIGPYLKNKKYWEKWFPADMISENYPGQYRGWFNALFWASVTLTGKAPFKSVFGYETLKDENGEEMHKSKGNAIWASEALETAGADPIRWLYIKQDPTRELLFGYNNVNEAKRSLNVFWNMANYLKILINSDFKPKEPKIESLQDRWIISRLESTKQEVTESLENLMPHIASAALEKFFLEDLSRTYIQWVRDILSKESKEAQNTIQIIYKCLFDTTKLLAPFIPFLTEKLYQDIFKQYNKESSIHHIDWPSANKAKIDSTLENQISIVNEVSSQILYLREKAQRNVRWPIKEAIIVTTDPKIKKAIKKHQSIISEKTNTLEIKTQEKEIKGAEYKVKANYSRLSRFGKDVSKVVVKLSQQSPKSILKKFEKDSKLTIKAEGTNFEILKTDLIIQTKAPKGFLGNSAHKYSIYIDLEETNEMLASGFARELTRKIQELRKKSGLKKPDRILLHLEVSDDLKEQLLAFIADIKEKVGADEFAFESTYPKKFKDDFKIKDEEIKIGFSVV